MSDSGVNKTGHRFTSHAVSRASFPAQFDKMYQTNGGMIFK